MQESVRQAMETQTAPTRLRGFDSLRGVAAFAVVLFHFTTGYESHFGPYSPRPLFYAPHGHFGVELFFCISGFVILGTIERSSSMKRFAIARFARIYPAFLVCALISLSTILLAHFNFPGLNPTDLLWNATMLTGLMGSPSIDPSYWTLSHEVLFYAAVALVWSVCGGRRRLEVPCLLWLATSFVGHCFPWVLLHHRLTVLLNIEYANLFVIGMMLHYLSQGSRTWLTIPTLVAAALLSLFRPEFNQGNLPQPAYVAMIVMFITVLWLIAHSRGRFLDIRPLVFLGEISYSLYLIHQIFGFAVIRIFLRAGCWTDAAICLTILLMIGLASCLRVWVEKPAERWIKNLGKAKSVEANESSLENAYAVLRTRA